MRRAVTATTDGSEPLEAQLVAQNDLEPVLLSTAESTPNVTVRFSCALADFQQDDGVTVTLLGDGGGPSLQEETSR